MQVSNGKESTVIKFACNKFMDETKLRYVPIEKVKEKRDSSEHLKPRDSEDFDKSNIYYVYWCGSGEDQGRNPCTKTCANQNNCDYYRAHIFKLAESENTKENVKRKLNYDSSTEQNRRKRDASTLIQAHCSYQSDELENNDDENNDNGNHDNESNENGNHDNKNNENKIENKKENDEVLYLERRNPNLDNDEKYSKILEYKPKLFKALKSKIDSEENLIDFEWLKVNAIIKDHYRLELPRSQRKGSIEADMTRKTLDLTLLRKVKNLKLVLSNLSCADKFSATTAPKLDLVRRYNMDAPVVEVKQGKLRGTVRDNIEGGSYLSFRGIPYADPPVGALRFKDPEKLKPWSGIRDALEESKMSAQFDHITGAEEGGDDCLYLDVATNSLTEKQPVLVWIHGGGFKRSSNTYKKYSPEYLLKKNVVFVSINYRLGVLGFLNMEQEECGGNQGLKDQVAALKWIQENIGVFGGDPKNVTIFGESAGGSSVHGLCLSPQAEGLFHKAITSSGVLSNPWAHISSNKDIGYSLAEAFGNKCSDASQVIQFLRTVSALELVKMYEIINKTESTRLTLKLVPTTDNKSSTPILPHSIKEMENKGVNVPLLIGYNSHEGILMFLETSLDLLAKEANNSFQALIALYLRIPNTGAISKFVNDIREYYFGQDEITVKNVDALVKFFGDMMFVANIYDVITIQQEKMQPTYFYKFSYRPDYPGIKERFNVKIDGTCHGDEMGCLFFSERRKKFRNGSRDRISMERLTSMWTNFARYGNPTPVINELITTEWRPIDKSSKHYLDINDELVCEKNPDDIVLKLWKPLIKFV